MRRAVPGLWPNTAFPLQGGVLVAGRVLTVLMFFTVLFFAVGFDIWSVVPRGGVLGDKQLHTAAFTLLSLGLILCWRFTVPATVAVLLLYGAAIEFLQLMVSGREARFDDFLADLCGVLIGAALLMFLSAVLRRRKNTVNGVL